MELPIELWELILIYCDYSSIVRLTQVNRQLHNYIQEIYEGNEDYAVYKFSLQKEQVLRVKRFSTLVLAEKAFRDLHYNEFALLSEHPRQLLSCNYMNYNWKLALWNIQWQPHFVFVFYTFLLMTLIIGLIIFYLGELIFTMEWKIMLLIYISLAHSVHFLFSVETSYERTAHIYRLRDKYKIYVQKI